MISQERSKLLSECEKMMESENVREIIYFYANPKLTIMNQCDAVVGTGGKSKDECKQFTRKDQCPSGCAWKYYIGACKNIFENRYETNIGRTECLRMQHAHHKHAWVPHRRVGFPSLNALTREMNFLLTQFPSARIVPSTNIGLMTKILSLKH